ncbi:MULTISPECIES: hypothetical protein [unclassified Anabaena]|uniref:hypothetical protein n=1 Tax=unclassified Anabaena TaxID=2619674 RepID=UPI0012E886C3|nr:MULTISPECIES: hypothetical protein [unclassified Anabaena]
MSELPLFGWYMTDVGANQLRSLSQVEYSLIPCDLDTLLLANQKHNVFLRRV